MRLSEGKLDLELLDAEGRRMGVGRLQHPDIVHQGECIRRMMQADGMVGDQQAGDQRGNL